MASNREGIWGGDYFGVAPDESLETFRARLKKITRERGVIVALGHEENAPPRKSAFALDSSPAERRRWGRQNAQRRAE
jgi:hypothetical protein